MIQVINRAFDILELVGREPGKVYTLTQIADELRLNHATCANIIKTMVNRNYLEQVGRKKGYRLGFMLFRVSGNNSYEKDLLKASASVMETLTKKLNETTLLGILKKDRRIAIHQENAAHDLMVRSSVEKPAYDSASGRLLIAMLEDKELEEYIEKYGLPAEDSWKEASSTRTFWKEVETIRKNKYATQTAPTHIVGVAVPIYKQDKVIASLSIYLPESRYNEKIKNTIIADLFDAADLIGKNISE